LKPRQHQTKSTLADYGRQCDGRPRWCRARLTFEAPRSGPATAVTVQVLNGATTRRERTGG